MKRLFWISIVLVIFISSCGKPVTDFSQLQDRNGIFFLINSDKPFTGKVVSKVNDTKMLEGAFKDGLRTGEWVYYYSNGQVQTAGTFIDGVKDGRWPVYKENGEVDYFEVFRFGNLIAGGAGDQGKEEEVVEEKEEKEEKEEVKEESKVQFVDWERLRGGSRKNLNGIPYTGGVIKYYKNTRDRELVGYFTNGYRSGKWTYYHKNGRIKDVRYY